LKNIAGQAIKTIGHSKQFEIRDRNSTEVTLTLHSQLTQVESSAKIAFIEGV
jgi:hypothetical protein